MTNFICGLLIFIFFFFGTAWSYSLIISEVFRDGTDERIEITNIGDGSFSGEAVLSGAKGKDIMLMIPGLEPLQHMILFDAGAGFSSLPDSCITVGNIGLSLSDTQTSSIELYIGGSHSDTFTLLSDQLDVFNNEGVSFIKEESFGEVTSSSGYYTQYLVGNFRGHPCSFGEKIKAIPVSNPEFTGGLIMTGGDGNSNVGSGIVDGDLEGGNGLTGVIIPGMESGDNQETTDVLSGSDSIPGDPSSSESSFFLITEVYSEDTDIFSEYIRVEVFGVYDGMITIEGLGHGSSEKVLSIDVSTGDVFYISDNENLFLGESKSYFVPSISLTNGGERLVVKDKNGRVHDRVNYSGGDGSKSLFFEHAKGEIRYLTRAGVPSLLAYLPNTGGCDLELHQGSGDSLGVHHLIATGLNQYLCSGLYTTSWSASHDGISNQKDACTLEIDTVAMSGLVTFDFQVSTEDFLLCNVRYSIFSSFQGSMCSDTSVLSNDKTPVIYIDEIYPYDDAFPEYVELYFLAPFSGELSMSGLGHGATAKMFSLNAYSGQRVVLSSELTGFSENTYVYQIDGLSLTNGGEEISLHRQDGHLLDTAEYSGLLAGMSRYRNAHYLNDRKPVSLPTPGFSFDQVKHLFPGNEDASLSCGIIIQNTTPIDSSNKVNLIATYGNELIQNSAKNYSCQRTLKGSQSESFTGCNPSYISYPFSGMYHMQLKVDDKKNGVSCSTESMLNLPGETKEGKQSGSNYYENLYHKWKERFERVKKGIERHGYAVTASGDVFLESHDSESMISGAVYAEYIVGVEPNPTGKDAGNEKIFLYNPTSGLLDMSSLGLSLDGKHKRLPQEGYILPGGSHILVGNLGLRNSSTCMSLLSGYNVLDRFCYPDAKEGVVYTSSIAVLETQSLHMREGLTAVTLKQLENQSCMFFGGEKLGCLDLPYRIDEINEWKKSLKSLVRLEKKHATLQSSLEKQKTKYTQQKDKLTQKIDDMNKKYLQEQSLRKLEYSFSKELLSLLRTKFSAVFVSEDLSTLLSTYNFMHSGSSRTLFSKLTARGVTIPLTEIVPAHMIGAGNLPLKNVNVDVLQGKLFNAVKRSVGNFTEYLYTVHTASHRQSAEN